MSFGATTMPFLAFPLPTKCIDQVVLSALGEDLGTAGDITSTITVTPNAQAVAEIVARNAGVIAGLEVVARVFTLVDKTLTVECLVADGDRIGVGSTVLRVSGNAQGILSAERTALNFLGHLSGVASATRELVDAVAHTDARICCTRKTTPGLRAFEKYAVRCGGGFNHRFGLGDGLLIKDNHILAANGIEAAVSKAKAHVGHMVKIEVEIDNFNQIEAALRAGADVIMLDNMNPEVMAEAVGQVRGRAVVEASGSITIEKVAAVAESGVDIISVGWITHSAPCLDLGLDFNE